MLYLLYIIYKYLQSFNMNALVSPQANYIFFVYFPQYPQFKCTCQYYQMIISDNRHSTVTLSGNHFASESCKTSGLVSSSS